MTGGIGGISASPDTTPWVSYVPTVVCSQSTGTCVGTGVGRYKTVGKTTYISVEVTVSGTFTAGGITSISLPNTAANQGVHYELNGRENLATGLAWLGLITANGTTIAPVNYTNNPTVASGYLVSLNGVYENQ